MKDFTITAHTGCENTPDNSIGSVLKAFDSGADIFEIDIRFDENKVMICVPKSLIENDGTILFKWADNYDENDFYSFYTKGDSAPYGRLCYRY